MDGELLSPIDDSQCIRREKTNFESVSLFFSDNTDSCRTRVLLSSQSSYIVEVSDGLSLPSKLVTGFYNNL